MHYLPCLTSQINQFQPSLTPPFILIPELILSPQLISPFRTKIGQACLPTSLTMMQYQYFATLFPPQEEAKSPTPVLPSADMTFPINFILAKSLALSNHTDTSFVSFRNIGILATLPSTVNPHPATLCVAPIIHLVEAAIPKILSVVGLLIKICQAVGTPKRFISCSLLQCCPEP